jgi:hypothetical protein
MLAGPEGKEAISSNGIEVAAWTEGFALLQVILVCRSDYLSITLPFGDSKACRE